LIPVDDEENFPKRSAQRIWRERHMSHPAPEVLLKKGDEVIRLFLSGEADQGFLSFALYLDYWLETKDVIMAEHPGMAEGFSELLKECLGAMQNKDLVSLIDAIEYGFKPLLERSLILSRNIRISGGDSQGFSAQELPR